MSTANDPVAAAPFRVLVVTVAHRGDDARIAHREIKALTRHGARVVYVAPPPAETGGPQMERILIARATGRSRVRAWRDAFAVVRRHRGKADIVLVHDLEAVLPVRLARPGCPVVWDVHEDLVASVGDRAWIPCWARPTARFAVAAVERAARAGTRLVLAEHSYRDRLGDWPIVPNSTVVPDVVPEYTDPEVPYAVYVGRLSRARGVDAMIALGADLEGDAEVVLIGPADPDVADRLSQADRLGHVRWLGPMANPDALRIVDGALVGLCLLAPLPNYVGSMPTKVYEYFAHGVPAIVSPLPLAAAAVREAGAGAVVEPADRATLAAIVRQYLGDLDRRRAEGRRAHDWVRRHHDWKVDGDRFVATLRDWASRAPDVVGTGQ